MAGGDQSELKSLQIVEPLPQIEVEDINPPAKPKEVVQ